MVLGLCTELPSSRLARSFIMGQHKKSLIRSRSIVKLMRTKFQLPKTNIFSTIAVEILQLGFISGHMSLV